MITINCKVCGCEVKHKSSAGKYCLKCSKEKRKLDMVKYKHTDHYKKKQHKNYLKYRIHEKYKEYQKQRRNTEKYKEYVKKYREKNKEHINELRKTKESRDRARKRQNNMTSNLNDSYVKQKLKITNAPYELIQLKRTQLMILRELKAAQ